MFNRTNFYLLNKYLENQITDYSYYNKFFNIDFNDTFNTHYESQLPTEYLIFHTSTPNVKLYYPEPFIATPTAVHDDIWFLHIVIYQYWLWFIFIFIIVFFFIVFLITLRWCNLRHRPVRETRGVSRSKCGDLITATVPVSWATSIIIHESTDAIEFNDGFGSTEMALGIRAYQWGWEYYYPKDLDLLLNDSHGKLIGNSIKNDFTLGSDQAKNLLKHNYTHANFNSSTLNSNFVNLLSLKSNSNKNLLSMLNLGNNKLVPKTATNLITKTKTLNLETTLNDGFDFKNYNDMRNYSIQEIYKTKPSYVNHQVNFFNNKSIYTNTLNFCNNSDKFNIDLVKYFNVTLLNTNVLNHYFSNKYENMITNFKINSLLLSFNNISNYDFINFNLTADQDFKRWSAGELIEDILWSNNFDLSTNLLYLDYELNTILLNQNKTESINYNVDSFNSTSIVYNFFQQSSKIKGFNYNNFENLIINNWLNLTLKDAFYNYKNNQFLIIKNNINFNTTLHKIWHTSLKDMYQNYAISNFVLDNSTKLKNLNYKNIISNLDILTGIKNLNTYSTAIWKIFKSTIEEERGFFNFLNYSNNDTYLPIIQNELMSNIQAMQKNSKSNFSNFILQQNKINLNPISFYNANNLFTFNFPFSLGFESDIIRYSWFDWYSIRNSLIAKAIDTSVFNLHGQKDYNYSFTTNRELSLINKSDNFFLKYQAARKLLTPVSIYTPLFYNKYQTYLENNSLLNQNSFYFWISKLKKNTNCTANLESLNVNNYLDWTATTAVNRNYKPSLNFINNETDLILQLNDILVKKNYILNLMADDNFKLNNKLILNKPLLYTIRNLKKYNATSYKPLNFYKKNFNSNFTLKSQYQPLKKGITNMIRIQADKAIAMPTDTRIQILAVSKDIIHSWAIPSAGIKIDCIPGYSSHRVAIFTLSGIYWGQCMEICGRFHHWMPIVVYFMRRDLFCVWCIHFIFKNKQTNTTLHSYELSYRDSFFSTNKNQNWAYL